LEGSDVINRGFRGFSNIPIDIYIISPHGEVRELQSVGDGIALHEMAFLGVRISVDPIDRVGRDIIDPTIGGLV
jgi:hypothetical protein